MIRKTPVCLVMCCVVVAIASQSSVSFATEIRNNVLEMTPMPTPNPKFGMAKMWARYDYWDTDVWVMNSFGDATILSPHRFELYTPDPEDELPWTFYSENCFIGKRTNVDISGAIRAIEELTGKQFIYTIDLPAEKVVDPEDWKATQTNDMIERAKQHEVDTNPWIEVPLSEALEEVDEVVYEPGTRRVRKYRLDKKKGAVEPYEVDEDTVIARHTGRKIKQPKEGVEFVEETGKFYRRRTKDDVDIGPEDVPEVRLPPYVTTRLKNQK